ncbi:hypothetical protein [Cryobacterium sp. TMT2-14]|uniref:hypothetical protein n=1 Tax=Cryobacterium sp. TMT2-14 TaxID=1259245 RepID=UPI00106C1D70|nr:hypothetical protein [Cryobacterium sp. TMT2-14]TFC38989.1 hypothetical protein E3O28_03920 [Cryobacterium sp. TMT2-14]
MTYVSRQECKRQLLDAAIETSTSADWPFQMADVPNVIMLRLSRVLSSLYASLDPSDPEWSSYRGQSHLTRLSPLEIQDFLRDALYEELRHQRQMLGAAAADAESGAEDELIRKHLVAQAAEIGRADRARQKSERLAREAAHALIGAEERMLEQVRLKEARLAREAEPGYVAAPLVQDPNRHGSMCPNCGALNQYHRICKSCRRVR